MPGKPLIFKDFRASLTLVPAGYIAAADAALHGDLPLCQRLAVAQPVAQQNDALLARGQAGVYGGMEPAVDLFFGQLLEQILLRADHVHQRQRVAVPPGLNAFRERNV